jgi:predicted dithiol-disulfide oxidoreductase (DUF899 family)
MTGYRFPNESDDYRARRDELLEMENDLRAQVEAVAQKRRELPLGGRLKEAYRFECVGQNGNVRQVAFEELFGKHRSLLLYTMMFGPDWDAPCPSCTSLVDGFNSNYYPISQRCAMAVVAAARPNQLHEWAQRRGWSIPLYSAAKQSYLLDYAATEGASDPSRIPMMNVFRKTSEGIFHTWGAELLGHLMENGNPRHVDMVWLYWNLLDLTPDGRGTLPVPVQDFEHAYFTRHVLGEGD